MSKIKLCRKNLRLPVKLKQIVLGQSLNWWCSHRFGHIYNPVPSQKNDLAKLTGCLPFPLYPLSKIFAFKVSLITSCCMKIDSNESHISIMTQERLAKIIRKEICGQILCFAEIVFLFWRRKKYISNLSGMLCSLHKVLKNTFARIAEWNEI